MKSQKSPSKKEVFPEIYVDDNWLFIILVLVLLKSKKFMIDCLKISVLNSLL